MSERNRCPKCGRRLEPSDVDGYKFVCYDCDENFYGFEAVGEPSETWFERLGVQSETEDEDE